VEPGRGERPAATERTRRPAAETPHARRLGTSGKPGEAGPRGERGFATPVKGGYRDRATPAPREAAPGRAPARRTSARPGADSASDAPRAAAKPGSGARPARPIRDAGGTGRADAVPRARRTLPERPRSAAAKSAAQTADARRTRDESHANHARRERGDAPGTLRLSKLMSELGLCSRREADEWIENGWVRVDGQTIDTLGTKVRPDQHIDIDPAAQAMQLRQVTILLHKPVGYVSGQAEDGYQPAATLITPANQWEGDRSGIRFSASHLRRLAPAGRLDIDSTGLLVLTQDGRIAKRLIGGHSEVEKEYLVRVTYGDIENGIDQHFPAEQLAQLRHGLALDDVPLKPAKVSWQNGEQLRFVLREGKKRQIRRMCELVGLQVVGLKRVRMGSVPLGALPPGQWRYLAAHESF
jgi:23S rRNA pseudouridine2604 synthase